MTIAGWLSVAILVTFIGIYMFLIANYLENDIKYILLGLGVIAIVLLIRGVKASSTRNQDAHGHNERHIVVDELRKSTNF